MSLLQIYHLSQTVKEFWKSVNIWESYGQDLFGWLCIYAWCLQLPCDNAICVWYQMQWASIEGDWQCNYFCAAFVQYFDPVAAAGNYYCAKLLVIWN